MGAPNDRYDLFTHCLIQSVLTTPGDTATELRRGVLERAARLGGRVATPGGRDEVPASLAPYIDSVALHAYRVTDQDLAALQRAGNSDDALFELTVAAALGAALGRIECGLGALRGEGLR